MNPQMLYISGPMTGYEDWNFPAFNRAAHDLEEAGYWIENPATKGIIDGWTWSDYLRYDLQKLLLCDGVALLDGWEDSRGAQLEVHVATALSIPTKPLDEWLKEMR